MATVNRVQALPCLNTRRKKRFFTKCLYNKVRCKKTHFSNTRMPTLSKKRDLTPKLEHSNRKERTPLFGRKGPRLDRKFENLLKLTHKSAIQTLKWRLRTYDEFSNDLASQSRNREKIPIDFKISIEKCNSKGKRFFFYMMLSFCIKNFTSKEIYGNFYFGPTNYL
ncbi:unnamed protein product [Moneuplotes crassus]|uniref:Uncharacterized protein n=1 Tax=Euplotes crassus TaxID=5936 RepID=A0AAD1U441_EUPCR|nr:unnamed protein product [Moneuplotes crassus]